MGQRRAGAAVEAEHEVVPAKCPDEEEGCDGEEGVCECGDDGGVHGE